jgi:type II secretory pathway component PulF
MPLYSYKARNNVGQLLTGSLEAPSQQYVIHRLREQQYTPVKIFSGAMASPKETTRSVAQPVRVSRVTIHDLVVFTTNLASMVNAGIPLLGALRSIAGQLSNPYLADIIHKISKMVSEGSSLSDAMEKYPGVFSLFYSKMVLVGETTGTLDAVLRTLADHLEQQEILRQKIKGALIYPAILITAGSGVITIILTLVMPRFVEIFSRAGVPLPLSTRFMYAAGMALQHYWWLFLILIGGAVIAVKMSLRTKLGRDLWDRFLLKLPLFGSLVSEILVVRFCRTLGALLNSGVPIRQGLDILKGVIDNSVFAHIVEEVLISVEKGEGVHRPLMKHSEFPKDVVYMISVGEESGKLALMLDKVADFYESKVEFTTKNLLVFIEPVFISVLGAIVGVMLSSVLLPMFDMVKTIQR